MTVLIITEIKTNTNNSNGNYSSDNFYFTFEQNMYDNCMFIVDLPLYHFQKWILLYMQINNKQICI